MSRSTTEVKKELEQLPATSFITKWVFEHTPYIFDDDGLNYVMWRETVASQMSIDPADIIVSGSACLGFSINPSKNYKAFDDKSDIDVCIISNYFFDTAWNDLLQVNRYRLNPKMQAALDDHRQRLIYFGTIATDKILPLLSFGPSWHKIIHGNRNLPILQDREINFRIYKDRGSVRRYLVDGIAKCKIK